MISGKIYLPNEFVIYIMLPELPLYFIDCSVRVFIYLNTPTPCHSPCKLVFHVHPHACHHLQLSLHLCVCACVRACRLTSLKVCDDV